MDIFKFEINSYRREEQHYLETIFCQANAYLGIRGYAEEGIPGEKAIPESFADGIASSPQQYVAAYFDHSPVTGDTMVNIPTLRLLYIFTGGEKLDLGTGKIIDYKRVLDMKKALVERAFTWCSPEGRTTRFTFRSFLSFPRPHLFAMQISIKPVNWDGEIQLRDCFDCRGKTIRHHHYSINRYGDSENGMFCEIRTNTSNLNAYIANEYDFSDNGKWLNYTELDETIVSRTMVFSAKAGQDIIGSRFLAVCTDFDDSSLSPEQRAKKCLAGALANGFDRLLDEQVASWLSRWEKAGIIIHGDSERTRKLNFSIFQLLQSYRESDGRLSIGAKMLSGDHYAGHYFWDTEIFIFPFFLYTFPDLAESLAAYRLKKLDGAMKKASAKGFCGAFYPWESAPLNADEHCPEWWQDENMDKPVRIPCGDIELHINGAVIYAVHKFLDAVPEHSLDPLLLCRLFIETARFWISRGEWEGKRFVIRNVIGPDEYHEHVDNNAYTNFFAKWNIEQGIIFIDSRQYENESWWPEEDEINNWRKCITAIETGLDKESEFIRQDDHFSDLAEHDWESTVDGEPLFRQLGMEKLSGLKVLKQADVLALIQLFPDYFSDALKINCWNYYEPRTAHDSNLSAGTHALVAARSAFFDKALHYYDMVLNLDFANGSYNVAEGIHAANAGNAWSVLVFGFAGIYFESSTMFCRPHLPKDWKTLEFYLNYRGRDLKIMIMDHIFEAEIASGLSFTLDICGQKQHIDRESTTIKVKY